MKKIKRSHIINGVLIAFAVLMIFSPDSKAFVTRGLMKIGMFRPNLEAPQVSEITPAVKEVSSTEGNGQTPVYFLDSTGQEIDAANQKDKVVFINFWATWCPPCIAEMPSIEKLADKFRDNDQVIFVMADVDKDLVKSGAFMTKRKLNLPVHVPAGAIPGHWLGSSIPTTIILDKNGMIAARHEGMADYSRQEVFDFINELLAE